MAQQHKLWLSHFGSSVLRKSKWLSVLAGLGSWPFLGKSQKSMIQHQALLDVGGGLQGLLDNGKDNSELGQETLDH